MPSLYPQLLTHPCLKHTTANRLKEQGAPNSITSSLPLLILFHLLHPPVLFCCSPQQVTLSHQECAGCQALPDLAQPLPQPDDVEMSDPALPWTPPAPRASPGPSPFPG